MSTKQRSQGQTAIGIIQFTNPADVPALGPLPKPKSRRPSQSGK